MTGASDDKRRANRLEHELPVAYRSVGSFLTDWATNISQGGMFINTRSPLPVGTDVKILIQLPTMEFPVGLSGKVMRVVEHDRAAQVAPGMAIQFTDVDPSRREQIESLVERLQRDLGS
ncbi:MAG TPA: TIGR02266 family protein [Anaeromyxobacteraceae bacterium]|nr:TIGR02266 family protein [Anaeromyxobacteraceae bacterium]